MGNSLGGRKQRARVMKIDGSSVQVKHPAAAEDVLRDHPGYVLLDSDQVRQFGTQSAPLSPGVPLKPGKLYFLVDLPNIPAGPQVSDVRVRSAIKVTAKDRIEGLMLSRRSASDVSFPRAVHPLGEDQNGASDGVRIRLRLPRAEVARLMEESKDASEAAEKIVQLCVGAAAGAGASGRHKKQKRTRFSINEDEVIS